MDNPIENVKISEKQVKDYWNLAYRNFIQIFWLGIILSFIFLWLWFIKWAPVYNLLNSSWLALTITFNLTVWFILAQLFKRHNKNAVLCAYVFLSIQTIWSQLHGINLIMILIYGYFFWLVLKANKMQPMVKE